MGCLACGGVFTSKTQKKFCCLQCSADWAYAQFIIRWKQGLETGHTGKTKDLSHYVRRYVREKLGTACNVCGWDERHPLDGAVLTEIDHIDGKAENTAFENLRVLCPNCHSKTPTFRARNKSSTRKR